jgi:hypothetical protein
VTWGEFKQKVEAQGVIDDTKLGYIDCSWDYDQDVSVSDPEDGRVDIH